ncbi:MAG TPA: hypothetical protein VGE29_15025 [Prosthecobacter sp.]
MTAGRSFGGWSGGFAREIMTHKHHDSKGEGLPALWQYAINQLAKAGRAPQNQDRSWAPSRTASPIRASPTTARASPSLKIEPSTCWNEMPLRRPEKAPSPLPLLTMLSAHLDSLKLAIEAKLHCTCEYAATVFVHHKADEALWRGSVDCFDLKGCTDSSKAFAWRKRNDEGESSYVIFPASAKVTSAEEAVQAHLKR